MENLEEVGGAKEIISGPTGKSASTTHRVWILEVCWKQRRRAHLLSGFRRNPEIPSVFTLERVDRIDVSQRETYIVQPIQ